VRPAENLAALAVRGHGVSYGQAIGALDPVNLGDRSGTFSQPVLFHHTADSLQEIAGRVFGALRDGILRPDVRRRYPLAAAQPTPTAISRPRTTGQIVLLA
jgi:NADPH2:quinone reductase